MYKMKKAKTIALTLACVPLCCAWTAAPAAAAELGSRYDGGGELIATYASETIKYVSREVVADLSTANGAPAYTQDTSLPNSCGPTAGAIVVGFYDKYYPNLISGWDSAYSTGRYKNQDATYVKALLQELYSSMRTNVVAEGVSEDECKDGLKSYVNNHGYNIEYSSLGSQTNFNYDAFKTSVQNNQVSMLFVKPSNLYRIASSTGEDSVTTMTITGNHVMVAYGYYEIKYTLSNGTRTDKYLYVSSGKSGVSQAFYKIGSYVDSAYVVKIS